MILIAQLNPLVSLKSSLLYLLNIQIITRINYTKELLFLLSVRGTVKTS